MFVETAAAGLCVVMLARDSAVTQRKLGNFSGATNKPHLTAVQNMNLDQRFKNFKHEAANNVG